jgi:hypothetical protein
MAGEATPPGGGYSADKLDQLLSLLKRRELDAQGAAEAAAKGAAGGGKLGGLPGALVGAGLSIATPFVTKALGSLFGVSDAEEEERQALDRAKAPFRAVAQGGTTQGQAGIAYARGRTLQDLASQTKRVSAQQLADTQAQYSAQLSDLRSREQERARAMLGSIEQLEAERAAKSAQRQRQALSQGIAGAVVPLAQQLLTPKTAAEVEADRQKESAAMGFSGQQPAESMSSGELASALGFSPGAAAAGATPAVASTLAAAVAGGAGAAPAAQPGYESLYTGPSIQTAPSANQQRIEQEAAMTAMAMRDPSKTAMAREYFAPAKPGAQDTLADLQSQRQTGMGLGAIPTGPYGSRVGTQTGMDAETRDIQSRIDINKSMSPFMKTSLGGEQVAPAPLTGDFQPTITDELRKQRPGRMPRRPRPVRGGGGYAF